MNTGTQAAKEAETWWTWIRIHPADRDRGNREATPDDSRSPDHVFHCQRCAKYFAIIPAMFAGTFPVLAALNIMHLKTPQSAIFSAVIFNALIIIALIPLALRGVKYHAMAPRRCCAANLLIYGVGGIIIPCSESS